MDDKQVWCIGYHRDDNNQEKNCEHYDGNGGCLFFEPAESSRATTLCDYKPMESKDAT